MAQITKPSVLITLDSMRYPNTGLYYFGKSLAEALLRQMNNRFDPTFFLYPGTTEFDNVPVKKKYFKKSHKFFYINTNNFNLFHFTDQHSRLKPKKVRSGKKILTIHDINQLHENQNTRQLNRYLKKLGERIYSCDKIITISKFAANDVLNYYPGVAGKISVIYNGADKLQLTPGHQPAYRPQKPFLFALGMVAPKKNFHVLPPLLVGNDYELIISGVLSPYQEVIMENARKNGVAGRVKLTGPISEEDRAWYYNSCEAFVFPSTAEGFGLPVVEAMHFGKPVFISTRTSLPEIGGDAAYYFESFDAEDMRIAFNSGMQHFNSDRSAKVIAHADKYNWDNTAGQYLDLYGDCIGNK